MLRSNDMGSNRKIKTFNTSHVSLNFLKQSTTMASPYLNTGRYEGTPTVSMTPPSQTLRHRQVSNDAYSTPSNGHTPANSAINVSHKKLKRLDLFEKVDSDLTVRTNSGGIVALVSWGLIFILSLHEVYTHMQTNGLSREHVVVDTSLGVDRRISVNINITFPSLNCADLHLDVMDVAGDSHTNLEEDDEFQVIKTRLKLDGSRFSQRATEKVEANKAAKEEKMKSVIREKALPEDYCGSCFGAGNEGRKCCNTCDEVIEAYKEKRWDSTSITFTSEQCIREGRDKKSIKRMSKGEGCNIAGKLRVNKVAGNFHIAMGEAVDMNGRHIHQFLPEDRINFNSSHIIHELSFGEVIPGFNDDTGLNGVSKIVTSQTGGTGVFQYYVKVVPSNFTNGDGTVIETNQYSFTERYSPLMIELDEEHYSLGDAGRNSVGAHAGGNKKADGHTHEHHWKENSILPGVFFIYDIYPFALEVSKIYVPFSHLLIRLMAVTGGILTVSGWIDGFMYAREKYSGYNRPISR